MAFRPVFLLPPLPRLRDWWIAGACAGLLLGLAELAVAFVDGTVFPTPLRVVLLAVSALLVSALSGGLGALFRGVGLRLSYSQLVGAVLGPLGLAVLMRPVWAWIAIGGAPDEAEGLQLGAGVIAILLAAVGAARIGERGERTGTAASGPVVWGGAALLLAFTSRLAAGGSLYTLPNVATLAVAVVVFAVAGVLCLQIARRRGMRSRAPFVRSLTLTSLAAGALCFAPGALPWLLYDEELAAVASGPPNILVALIGTGGDVRIPGSGRVGTGAEAPNLGLLAWNGIAYAHLAQDWVPGAAATLSLADGTTLPERLEFSGYSVGAIHRSPELARDMELRIEDLDARPGAARALRESGEWLSAAPLLLGPGSAALDAAGLNHTERSTHEVAASTMSWLLNWRTRRSASPFFLLVDLRRGDGEPDLEQADSALASILEHLNKLEAEANTLVLVTLEDRRGVAAGRKRAAVVRPPLHWTLPGPGTRATGEISARDIAVALQKISESDGTKPLPFPGVPFDDGEEQSTELTPYQSDYDRWLKANPLPQLPKLPGS